MVRIIAQTYSAKTSVWGSHVFETVHWYANGYIRYSAANFTDTMSTNVCATVLPMQYVRLIRERFRKNTAPVHTVQQHIHPQQKDSHQDFFYSHVPVQRI